MNSNLTMQLMGEFFGTIILVLLGDGVCAGVNLKKSKAEGSGWVAISFGWGFRCNIWRVLCQLALSRAF